MPLSRTLSFVDFLFLVIGSVIGSGIFLVPSVVMVTVAASPGLALSAWCFGGLLSLLGALTYSELCAQNPTAGGLYAYIRDGIGRLPAFLYGWGLFLVMGSGAVAALSVAFSVYLGRLVTLTPTTGKIVAVLIIAGVAGANAFGVRYSALLQNWGTAIKVAALSVMTVILIWFGNPSNISRGGAERASLPAVTGFGAAMVSVLWAYEGWQYCTFSAGEVKRPRRDIPLGFLCGLAGITLIFVSANLGYLMALGATGMATTDSVAAQALKTVAGPTAEKIISAVILVSTLSSANAITVTTSRVYYAMAEDGVFFRTLGRIHPRFKTPFLAILAGSAWSAVLAFTGTFQQLLICVVSTGWLFYGLGALTIFRYRRANARVALPYKVPGYPWTPLVFIGSDGYMVVCSIVSMPRQAFLGIGILMMGLPAYAFWRHQRSTVPNEIRTSVWRRIRRGSDS